MDHDFYWRRGHVPAFGSWDCSDGALPFTQCFDSACRHTSELLRYSYSEDRDLYVTGDLYDNAVVTPAMIVVPARRRGKSGGYGAYAGDEGGEGITKRKEKWVDACNCECESVKQPSTTAATPPADKPSRRREARKAVDEDLYKISPHLLRRRRHGDKRKRRGWVCLSIMWPSRFCF